MCKNFMVIRHSIKELLAKSMVTRPMKCIVDIEKQFDPNIFELLRISGRILGLLVTHVFRSK